MISKVIRAPLGLSCSSKRLAAVAAVRGLSSTGGGGGGAQGAKKGEYVPTNLAYNDNIKDSHGIKVFKDTDKHWGDETPEERMESIKKGYQLTFEKDPEGEVVAYGYKARYDCRVEEVGSPLIDSHMSTPEKGYALEYDTDERGKLLSYGYKAYMWRPRESTPIVTQVEPPSAPFDILGRFSFNADAYIPPLLGYGNEEADYPHDASAKKQQQQQQEIAKTMSESTSNTSKTDHQTGDCRFETEREAMNSLISRGFHDKFQLVGGRLALPRLGLSFHFHNARIIEIHRFEGVSNPDDNLVIFAIEAKAAPGPNSVAHRGILVSDYGSTSSADLGEFSQRASRKREDGDQRLY